MSLRAIRNDQRGFTLIELLVVILIIGVLAAIAIPVFLNQQQKGQDAAAKAAAKDAVTQITACFVLTQNYSRCDEASELDDSAVDVGGVIAISDVDGSNGFAVTATSKSGNTFTVRRGPNVSTRTCTGSGGCNNLSW